MSEIIKALLSVIEIITDNPQFILIVLGFLAILAGWAFDVVWLIALGLYILIVGIVGKKSRGEISRSHVHY